MKVDKSALPNVILQRVHANEINSAELSDQSAPQQKFPNELLSQLNSTGDGVASFGQANLSELQHANASGRYESFRTVRNQGKDSQKGYEFADFTVEVRNAISQLDSKETGETMLKELDAGVQPGADLRIRRGKANGAEYRHPDGRNNESSPAYRSKQDETRGAGSVGTDVTWNPESRVVAGESRPPFIGLGHELVHAHRGHTGHAVHRGVTARELFVAPTGKFPQLNKERNEGIAKDEAETVGIIDHAVGDDVFIPTENKLREEHGIRSRTTYGDFVKK